MVIAAAGVLFGRTLFPAVQAQFFTAGIRQGLTRPQLRSLFRTSFGRGFGNAAYADARRTLTDTERAGVRLLQRDPVARLLKGEIPRVVVTNRKGRYVLTGTVRTRISSTGTELTRIVRFSTDEQPTSEMFNRRAKQIIDKGIERGDSDMEIIGVTGLTILEQVEEQELDIFLRASGV